MTENNLASRCFDLARVVQPPQVTVRYCVSRKKWQKKAWKTEVCHPPKVLNNAIPNKNLYGEGNERQSRQLCLRAGVAVSDYPAVIWSYNFNLRYSLQFQITPSIYRGASNENIYFTLYNHHMTFGILFVRSVLYHAYITILSLWQLPKSIFQW